MASIDQLRSGHPMTTTRSNHGSVSGSTSGAAKNQQPTSVGSGQKDAVSLSSQGKAVGQIHQQLAAEPSFDSAKVAAIKDAISNGSYVVDADKLASNMMKFEDELRGI
ncbi:flagellar biosynthesis anti-sigma factor FlgM [Photobacterium chitinilyticum]|uniref:Negative regulator of flagellin synthesis n=1 Tax=Photobacterium chitinilyticum TaxID=2485123 RepID=A0A3S3UL36_9GAMM|nr:flagellar biosynthesis anti-sigma factor FlgM [Photobacterium chitinilyticum]RWX56521.1 flagellar biosynthesis anti-sigma factor FlgM [Photobacterium chitinilyticum]